MKPRQILLLFCLAGAIILFINGIMVLTMPLTKEDRILRQIGNIDRQKNNIGEESNTLHSVNLLILGLDEEEERSDVIVVLNYSPEDGSINILSIARDTRVRAEGKWVKFNALVGMGDERLVIEEVEELTGLNIHYYLTLNFEGFRKIVDILEGVTLDVPFNMDYDDSEQNLHIHLKKGKQLLDGKKAEQLVRYRKGNQRGQGYIDGDIGRIRMQQDFIQALLQQKLKLKYISKADDIYLTLKKFIRTNVEIGDINYYLKYLQKIDYSKVRSFSLPGDSSYINKVWYFICNKEKTKNLILEHFFK